jgi:hypothetical protein
MSEMGCLTDFLVRYAGAKNVDDVGDISHHLAESEGRGGTLDTLPEEKSTSTQYRRVYSDWRPIIEKTDVVGAMEAIEGGYFVILKLCAFTQMRTEGG